MHPTNSFTDSGNPPFIADQRLSVLELSEKQRRSTLHYLRLAKLPDTRACRSDPVRLQGTTTHWRVEKNRYVLMADLQHRCVAIISGSGYGKTQAIDQMGIARMSAHPEHLVISIPLHELPINAEKMLDRLAAEYLSQLKQSPVIAKDAELPSRATLSKQIERAIRCGDFTLAVDELDEAVDDAVARIRCLRRFLQWNRQCKCVIAARRTVIIEDYWRSLFSRQQTLDDQSSSWEFWLVEPFNIEQTKSYFGTDYRRLPEPRDQIRFSPRGLHETFCELSTTPKKCFQSIAELYWICLVGSLRKECEKQSSPDGRRTLSYEELLNLLSAIAATLVMWNDNPHRERKPGKGLAPAGSSPVLLVDAQHLSAFKNLVFLRVQRIQEIDQSEFERMWTQLVRLNIHLIEFAFTVGGKLDGVYWRQKNERDFFAAMWMTRSADAAEFDWLIRRARESTADPAVNEEQRNDNFSLLLDLWRAMPVDGKSMSKDSADRLGYQFDSPKPSQDAIRADVELNHRQSSALELSVFTGGHSSSPTNQRLVLATFVGLVILSLLVLAPRLLTLRLERKLERESNSRPLETSQLRAGVPRLRELDIVFGQTIESDDGRRRWLFKNSRSVVKAYEPSQELPIRDVFRNDTDFYLRLVGERRLTNEEWFLVVGLVDASGSFSVLSTAPLTDESEVFPFGTETNGGLRTFRLLSYDGQNEKPTVGGNFFVVLAHPGPITVQDVENALEFKFETPPPPSPPMRSAVKGQGVYETFNAIPNQIRGALKAPYHFLECFWVENR
ncbi:NACHT domain-containing protein [Stieleria varia]|uniref:Uncharacterized protein n=1 Tax=Stieleria varia TaxID=2528005 RepID=A0A5C5ZSH2_9BACT|nr:hypothetical protein [Stieleria varia]TWT89163.1 hypothetical protein Pla52n_68960 [Stieleria varia]